MAKRNLDRKKLIDEICARLSEGEPLRQICRDAHMPHFSVVYEWMEGDEEIARRIAQARKRGYDAIAEDALRIADTQVEAVTEEISDERGRTIKKADAVHHRKLQVWARLQLLSKWYPEKYGDKQAVELSGPGGKPLDDSTTATRVAALLAKGAVRAARAAAVAEGGNAPDPAEAADDDYRDLL